MGDSILQLNQHTGSYVRNSSDLALMGVEYRITEEGKYEFRDNRVSLAGTGEGFKPITERTFYLQTKRKGMLPEELKYSDFIEMSIAEQQTAFNGNLEEEPFYVASAVNEEAGEKLEDLPKDAESQRQSSIQKLKAKTQQIGRAHV